MNPNRQISREISNLRSILDETVKDALEPLVAIQRFFDFVEEWEKVCPVGHDISWEELVFKKARN